MENLPLARDIRFSVNEATANKTFIMLQRKREKERGEGERNSEIGSQYGESPGRQRDHPPEQCPMQKESTFSSPYSYMGIQWKADCAGLHQLIHEEDTGLKVK